MTSKRAKGFSLVEAMLSTAIIAVIIALMFNMSSSLFSVMSAQGSKQDETKKFINVYNNLNRTLSMSAPYYFYSYYNEGKREDYRWFFYPCPTDSDGICQASNDRTYWMKVYFWFLRRPDGDKCQPEIIHDGMRCPHKKLVRLCYDYTGSQENSYFCEALNQFCEHCDVLMTNPVPAEKISLEINGEKADGLFVLSENKTIAENILDLETSDGTHGKTINFSLTTIKLAEAEKKIRIGDMDLTKSKYAEKETWAITPAN